MIDATEATRSRFRPPRITTLLVGESAPVGGAFFYNDEDSNMRTYMARVIDEAFGASDADFRERFRSLGWYLDDLSLIPVNGMPTRERNAICREAVQGLAARIAEYQPEAIVTLLMSIKPNVDAAVRASGSNARCFAVPFPGMGQQARFRAAMLDIIPQLPRI